MGRPRFWVEVKYKTLIVEEASVIVEITNPFVVNDADTIVQAAKATAEDKKALVSSKPDLMKIVQLKSAEPEILRFFPDDGSGQPNVYQPIEYSND